MATATTDRFVSAITEYRLAFELDAPSTANREAELLAMTGNAVARIESKIEKRLFAATVTVAMWGHRDDLPGMLASIEAFDI